MGCAGKLIDDGSPSRSPPLPEEGCWLTASDEEEEQGGRGRGPKPRRDDETQPSAGKHSSSRRDGSRRLRKVPGVRSDPPPPATQPQRAQTL